MFDRADERHALLFHLSQGRSVLMLAPRRVGKTWLIKRLAEDLKKTAGWTAILCDVEGMSEPAEFLRHLCRQIEQHDTLLGKAEARGKQLLGQALSGDFSQGWQTALGKMDWASFAETLVGTLAGRGRDIVIIIDELALFVNALLRREPATAKDFLYRLRFLAQKFPEVRWLFTGSIGLDVIAKREGIGGALVDLKLFPIEPFSPEAARAFLDHLSASGQIMRPFALDDPGFAKLAEELGWLSPYYLEHIAQEICPDGPVAANGRRLATTPNIEAAFAILLDHQHRNYFVTWEEHLDKNFPSTEAAAMRRVLDICARQPSGERLDTLTLLLGAPPDNIGRRALLDALTILVADGYLSEIPDGEAPRYRFRSGLLRRYWLRYHAE